MYNVVSYNQPLRYSSIAANVAGAAAAAFAAATVHYTSSRMQSLMVVYFAASSSSSYFSYEYRSRSPVVRIVSLYIVFLYCIDVVYS